MLIIPYNLYSLKTHNKKVSPWLWKIEDPKITIGWNLSKSLRVGLLITQTNYHELFWLFCTAKGSYLLDGEIRSNASQNHRVDMRNGGTGPKLIASCTSKQIMPSNSFVFFSFEMAAMLYFLFLKWHRDTSHIFCILQFNS